MVSAIDWRPFFQSGAFTRSQAQALQRMFDQYSLSVDGVTAPANAAYVTVTANGLLVNERVLTQGTGITITDGGANSTITVTNADRGSVAVTAHEAAVDPHPQYATAAELANYVTLGTVQTITANKSIRRDAATTLALRSFGNGASSDYPALVLGRHRGTFASAAAVLSGDYLGEVRFSGGFNTSSEVSFTAGAIRVTAVENFSTVAAGAKIQFLTAPVGSDIATEVMSLQAGVGAQVTGALAVTGATTLATTLNGYMKTASGVVSSVASIPNTDITGLGTMATQNASAVSITGGTINGTSIGATTRSTAQVTTLNANSTITNVLATNKQTTTEVPGSSAISDFSAGIHATTFSRSLDGARVSALFAYENGSALHRVALVSRGEVVFATGGEGLYTACIERGRFTNAGLAVTGAITATTTIRPGSYTVGTVPSAATAGAGALIYVSNESGGAITAFSDGSSWRRVSDRAVIS